MKKLIIAAAAVVAMASCTENNDLVQSVSDNVVNFSSEAIGTRTTTGEDGDSWLEGDPIGVYSVGFDTDYQNVKYLAQTAGASTTFKAAGDAILYPNVTSATVDFYAYYPFSTLDKNNYIEIDISGQKGNYNAVDFMIAGAEDVTYGMGKNTDDVSFVFVHRLSKVVMNISSSNDLASLEGLTANFSNIYTQALYDYVNDQITNDATGSIDLTVIEGEKDDDGNIKTATVIAILLPGTYTLSSVLEFKVDARVLYAGFSTKLTEGYSHTFNLTLGNDITGFESGSTIGDWNSDETETPLYSDQIMDIAYNGQTETYEITTALGLKAFAALVNGEGKPDGVDISGNSASFDTPNTSINGQLMNDINLFSVCYSVYSIENGFEYDVNWIPIGSAEHPYTGIFDGNGFKVECLYINDEAADYQGLFGVVDGGTIKNLGVSGSGITSKDYVGGVAGYVDSSTITDCYSSGSIKASGEDAYVGGVVGCASASTITGCYNLSKVAASGEDANVGGIVGSILANAYDASITSCYSCGLVSAACQNNLGGLVGSTSSATISYCYYDLTVIENYTTSYYKPTSEVGSDTNSSISQVLGLSTDNMKANILTPLNTGSEGSWKADTGINDGYPILSWQ